MRSLPTQFHKRKLKLLVLGTIVAVCVSILAGNATAQQSVPATGNPPGDAPAATGQTSQTSQRLHAEPNGTYTLHTTVTEVLLYADVLNRHQQLVTTLHKQDFKVYEDNVPQVIAAFHEGDIPVSLAILIDNSASMQPKRAAVNVAAIDLVRASNPRDESFLVNFSDEAILDQDFTSNVHLLEKGLSHITSQGGTALYDAVIAAADHLAQKSQRAKQVILIVTDGEDNSSSANLNECVRTVQKLNAPIVYSIGLLYDESNGERAGHARKALQTLSDQTGGIAFFPKSLDEVDAITKEVARDIRQQYTLGYHPAKPITGGGGYRTIRVTAKAKGMGKLTVRTRHGYYPHPIGAYHLSDRGNAQ